MNLALKQLRRAGREVPTEAEVIDALAPETVPIDTELRRLVRTFKGRLDERSQAVVAAYFEEGRSQAEVASALGLSRDQVYRSIVKIREAALAFFKETGWVDGP